MTIGDKIKSLRKAKGLTQAELCDGRITRNMLSVIENGNALPSLETLIFLAERLGVPAGYIISDEPSLSFYTKETVICEAKELYKSARYGECVNLISKADINDDESNLLLAYSSFELAKYYFGCGSMLQASRSFTLALDATAKTIYDTDKIKLFSPIYLSVCKNISLPLLELDVKAVNESMSDAPEYQFYKYLLGDSEFSFTQAQYSEHIKAKSLIKERRYTDAVKILTDIENNKGDYPKNAYLMFLVYADLESCYKKLTDFERAYKYASKRISLMEGFSS